MIKYYEGTVFNADTQAIVNTINCVGVMGTGIALEFRLRYPDMYSKYLNECNLNSIKTGHVYYYNIYDKIIVNFPTKHHFKYPSRIIWIEQGLQYFIKTYKQQGITSIAFPKLGASNGALNWNEVKLLMEKYLSNLDINVYICLDNNIEAEGIERKMLEKFNSFNIENLSKIVKLNTKQKQFIESNKPYKRFWKIGETDYIGIKTYSSIFTHFYNSVINNDKENIQLSLF